MAGQRRQLGPGVAGWAAGRREASPFPFFKARACLNHNDVLEGADGRLDETLACVSAAAGRLRRRASAAVSGQEPAGCRGTACQRESRQRASRCGRSACKMIGGPSAGSCRARGRRRRALTAAPCATAAAASSSSTAARLAMASLPSAAAGMEALPRSRSEPALGAEGVPRRARGDGVAPVSPSIARRKTWAGVNGAR